MADLLIEVQGTDAIAATESFLAIDGISGSYEMEEETSKEGVLVTVATIVGIVGGTITIAEKIYSWYQAWQKRKEQESDKTVEKVLLVGRNGQRLLLKNATIEQIQQILDD